MTLKKQDANCISVFKSKNKNNINKSLSFLWAEIINYSLDEAANSCYNKATQNCPDRKEVRT